MPFHYKQGHIATFFFNIPTSNSMWSLGRKIKTERKMSRATTVFEDLKKREWGKCPWIWKQKSTHIGNKKGVADITVNLLNIILKVLDGAIK